MLINKAALLAQLAPPLDTQLVSELIDEFVSLERRYIQREWEPTQLDGGQFCELLGRIIYHADSGTLSRGKDFEGCEKYIRNEQVPHALNQQDSRHVMMVLRTAYNFRSKRGAIHISPTYKPNHMDSKFVVDCVRWAFAEALRMFWNGDREKVASAVRELLQFDVPAIAKFDEGLLMVQRTDLTVEEEVLLLLHYAGESGFSRHELGRYVRYPSQRISDSIKILESTGKRQIVRIKSGNYRLTDLGSKRIREQLADKLVTM